MSWDDCPAVLKALSGETRWGIVRVLFKQEWAIVNDLATKLRVPQPTMSKHLRILRKAGVIVSKKVGKALWCRIAPQFCRHPNDRQKLLDLGCCSFRFD
jgi:DNA-binding transcriptional ArsR family regulator